MRLDRLLAGAPEAQARASFAALDGGERGVRFLESPSSSLPRDRNRRLYAPHPVSVPPPPYPEELLPKRRPPVTVTLRIVLETDGTVGEIFDSPLASAPLAAEDAPFRDAAVEAVRSWKFIPARVEILRDGTDLDGDGNPDYQIRVSLNAVRYYLDVAITFEIVEGKGKVQTGLAPGGQGARR